MAMALDIKARLREQKLKQTNLAQRLGVSDATISLWGAALRQGDYRRVPAERARDLASALGVPVADVRPDLFPTEAA